MDASKITTVTTRYIEFLTGPRDNLSYLLCCELNGKDSLSLLPENCTAYRFIDIHDRVDENGEVIRPVGRTTHPIVYL
nr:hypothetical protein [uncultured archaeon]AQS29487.1 hypothetical protein [uncultured archaeon]